MLSDVKTFTAATNTWRTLWLDGDGAVQGTIPFFVGTFSLWAAASKLWYYEKGGNGYYAGVYSFDPDTATWSKVSTTGGSTSQGRFSCSAEMDGKLYVLGDHPSRLSWPGTC